MENSKKVSSRAYSDHEATMNVALYERRRHAREKVSATGYAELDAHASVACVVRDLSPVGARLSIIGPFPAPGVFNLRVPELSIQHRVKVVWRLDGDVGVRFCAN